MGGRTMRIKHKVRVRIAEDADMKDGLAMPDDTLSEVVIDNYQKQATNNFSVAASASEDLPLGDITAVKGVFVKVDQEVTIKINGSTTPLQLRKGTNATYAKIFLEADITAIEVTAGASIATGIIVAWGDPTA